MSDTVAGACALLHCPTPRAWLDAASGVPDELFIDHANCEKKAASLALSLLFRYSEDERLVHRMSRIAREELRHFEQVLGVLHARGIRYRALPAGRYAAELRGAARTGEPERLVDTLLVSAIVEARSCERFLRLTEVVPASLATFYGKLLDVEARHYAVYLELARVRSPEPVEARLDELLSIEAALVNRPDPSFRFHSGPPG